MMDVNEQTLYHRPPRSLAGSASEIFKTRKQTQRRWLSHYPIVS